MALLTRGTMSAAGVATNLQAVSASDTFDNDGQTFLDVNNANAGTVTLVFDDPQSVSPSGATSFNPDLTATIATGVRKRFGPFPIGRFNDPTTGRVTVTFSPTSSVTAEPVRLPY